MEETPGWVDPAADPPASSTPGPPATPTTDPNAAYFAPPVSPPASPPQWGQPGPNQQWGQPVAPQWGQPGPNQQWGQPVAPQYGQYGQYPAPGQQQWGPPQYGQFPPSGQYPPGQYAPPGQSVPGYYTPPPHGWGGGYQQEYKPGIVPLRPLSIGEILDGSFSTIRKHPRIVFGWAAVLGAAAELIRVGLGYALHDLPATLGANSFSADNNTDNQTQQLHQLRTSFGQTIPATLISLVVNALCTAILAGIVTNVVSKAILGQKPDGRAIFDATRRRWFGLLIVSVLAELLPVAPVLLLVGGIALVTVSTGLGVLGGVIGGAAALVLCPLLWGRLAVAVPVFVLERLGARASIARSWRLVRGAFWRVWLLRALVVVIVTAATSALSLPLVGVLLSSAVKHQTPSTVSLVFAAIIGTVIWTLVQPITAASLTLIYTDRRMRAEGLDLQLAQAARAAQQGRA